MEIRNTVLAILIGFTIMFCKIKCETRYTCLRNRVTTGPWGWDATGTHDSSSEEEEGEIEGEGGSSLRGTLSCVDVSPARILVTKVIHGNGGFYSSCAHPNEHCDETVFTGSQVGEMCDRKSTCLANGRPKFLPRCGLMSNFIHVEYECVSPWSVFDICHDITTMTSKSQIYVISPPMAPPTSSKCECIITPKDEGDANINFIHSNTEDADCDVNFLLIEAKPTDNATKADEPKKVCGRRHMAGTIYHGSLRLTYGTRSRFLDDGFLSRISGSKELEVECGKVYMAGDEETYRGPPPRRPRIGRYPPPRRHHRPVGYRDSPNNPYGRFMTTVPTPFKGPTTNDSSPSTNASDPWESRWDRPRNRLEEPTFRRGPPPSFNDRPPHQGPDGQSNNGRPGQWSSSSFSRGRGPGTTVPPFDTYRRGRYRGLDLFYEGPRHWGPTTPYYPRRYRNNQYPRPRQWDQFERNAANHVRKSTNMSRPIPKLDSAFFGNPNASQNLPEIKPKLPSSVEFIGNSVRKESIKPTAVPVVVDSSQPPPPPINSLDLMATNNKLRKEETADGAEIKNSSTAQLVAFVMAACGVLLIACGAIFFILRYTRKRRRTIETECPYGVENQGQSNEEPVYTLPSNGSLSPPLQSHFNSAYVSDPSDRADGQSETSINVRDYYTEDDENPYSTVFATTESDTNDDQKASPETTEQCVGTSVQSRLALSSIYDNNI